MKNLPELLQFILRHDYVIVFGNLGRYPQVVFDLLVSDPQLNVAIQSPYYLCEATPDNRIRVVNPHQSLDPCDLLVVLEPIPYKLLEKPPQATRLVVFTSHLTYTSRPETVWTHVCYFNTQTFTVPEMASHTQALLKIQDSSLQTQNISQVSTSSLHTLVLHGQSDSTLDTSGTYVIVDLNHHSDAFTMYLAFWDAFDHMLAHRDLISGWILCFPPANGRRVFDQFVQNCLDTLFCKTFEHGNVTSTGSILSLLPYYRSGCIDKRFQVPKDVFGGVEYIAPDTPLEVCKAATMYNLEHWVGNIYRIQA